MHPTHISITSTPTQSRRCVTVFRPCLQKSSEVRQTLRWRVSTLGVRSLICPLRDCIWQFPLQPILVPLSWYLELSEQRRRLRRRASLPLPSAGPQDRKPDTLRPCRPIWPYTQTYRRMSPRASWHQASRTFHPVSGSTSTSQPWAAVPVPRLPTSASCCPESTAQPALLLQMSRLVDRRGFRPRPRSLVRRGVMQVSVWETLSLRRMQMRLSRLWCWRSCRQYSPVCLEENCLHTIDVDRYIVIPTYKIVKISLANAI